MCLTETLLLGYYCSSVDKLHLSQGFLVNTSKEGIIYLFCDFELVSNVLCVFRVLLVLLAHLVPVVTVVPL